MPSSKPRHTRAEGWGAAALAGNLFEDDSMRNVWDLYHDLDSADARAVFACRWCQITAKNFDRYWPILYEMLALVRDRELYKDPDNLKDMALQECQSFEDFFTQVMRQPYERWSELEATYRMAATYCPDLLKRAYGEAKEEAGKLKEHAMDLAGPSGIDASRPHGTNQYTDPFFNCKTETPIRDSPEEFIKSQNINSSGESGTAAAYRVARLKRDHPEIAERLAAGEFKSVRAAERAAKGEDPHPPRKKRSALEWLQTWWGRANEEEQEAFRQEITKDERS